MTLTRTVATDLALRIAACKGIKVSLTELLEQALRESKVKLVADDDLSRMKSKLAEHLDAEANDRSRKMNGMILDHGTEEQVESAIGSRAARDATAKMITILKYLPMRDRVEGLTWAAVGLVGALPKDIRYDIAKGMFARVVKYGVEAEK